MSEPDDTRIVECTARACDGGRRYVGHPNDPDPDSYVCDVCGGTGEIEIEVVPLDLDDLAEMSGTAPWP